jgi:hypothetical protein
VPAAAPNSIEGTKRAISASPTASPLPVKRSSIENSAMAVNQSPVRLTSDPIQMLR